MDSRIVFMGTPDFAATVLKELLESGKRIVGVVTAPDRPAGRGQRIKISAVKELAIEKNIPVLQPVKLKDPGFIKALEAFHADLFIVVAFRMLPEAVWTLPAIGTFNLHASLLPQYRGAAPINWAIINGEKETGLTTFMIDHEIDTGKIILQEKVKISNEMTAGDLHDILMTKGARLVIKTVDLLFSGSAIFNDQQSMADRGIELRHAPKLFKEDCRINWNMDSKTVYNLVRGLSPYPGAWTVFINGEGEEFSARITRASICKTGQDRPPGSIELIDKQSFKVYCKAGALEINTFQPEGKKSMQVEEFLRGYRKKLVSTK